VIAFFIATPLLFLNHFKVAAGVCIGQISTGLFCTSLYGDRDYALITVSFQSIRAAIANPVKSLRTE
jgi:hypothetical protein